jgi:hypothetical protein
MKTECNLNWHQVCLALGVHFSSYIFGSKELFVIKELSVSFIPSVFSVFSDCVFEIPVGSDSVFAWEVSVSSDGGGTTKGGWINPRPAPAFGVFATTELRLGLAYVWPGSV